MGYKIDSKNLNDLFDKLRREYVIYAPKVFKGEGTYSDTDRIRYGEITQIEEVEFKQKSEFSYKEILTPISDTLFYFTENEIKEADAPIKGAIVFLRSCDLHAVKRMDDIYLKNGFGDYYYKRLREKTKFILMGCSQSFDSCFCVDMETNQAPYYDAYIKVEGEAAYIESQFDTLSMLLDQVEKENVVVTPDFVTENETRVNIPDNLSPKVRESKLWDEYQTRCIACGRCNFVCPTCTCFTMQDIFYADNGKVGERRRVWASCQVDGYTNMAGGHSFRENRGQRMRFKVLHKVHDYKKRFGYHMCVGCGRCDDICPEYISFSNCINKLSDAMKEVE